jgi:hypothetical protein
MERLTPPPGGLFGDVDAGLRFLSIPATAERLTPSSCVKAGCQGRCDGACRSQHGRHAAEVPADDPEAVAADTWRREQPKRAKAEQSRISAALSDAEQALEDRKNDQMATRNRWRVDKHLRAIFGCNTDDADHPTYQNGLARYIAAENKLADQRGK